MGQNIFERAVQRHTLFRDKNLIMPHYTPKELPFREKQIEEVMTILTPALRGEKADNLFIYGVTGSGKTCVTRHVMQQLLEFAGAKNVPVNGCYINCRTHSSKYRVLIKAVQEFYPADNFMGYSAAFIHDKIIEHAVQGRELVLVLDEIDMVKDVDDLVYELTRANDELKKGSVSIIGISNNLRFKDNLDPRTKSSLCEHEMVFPPYDANELREILKQRVELAFKPKTVASSAIGLAAALAASESGDARTAVMLLLRAGEIADRSGAERITDEEVKKAKSRVEDELILDMVCTMPRHQKLVLYTIAKLSTERNLRKITGEAERGVLYSGEVYDEYCRIAKHFNEGAVSSRWYRQCISELELYGIILTTASGKGVKGQTRFIKLGCEPKRVIEGLGKEFAG